jgi:hypothetical protein
MPQGDESSCAASVFIVHDQDLPNDRICDYLSSTPTVYLPAHDPATAVRLRDAQVTQPLPNHARGGVRKPGQHETLFQE